jgi:hypothetical protein
MRAFSVFLAVAFTIGGILLLLRVGVDRGSAMEPYRMVAVVAFFIFAILLGIAPFTRMWIR